MEDEDKGKGGCGRSHGQDAMREGGRRRGEEKEGKRDVYSEQPFIS